MFYFELGPHCALITHVAFLVFLLFDLLLIVLLDFHALLVQLMCCSVTGSPGAAMEHVCPVHVRRSADAVTAQTLLGSAARLLRSAAVPQEEPGGFGVHKQAALTALAYLDACNKKAESCQVNSRLTC